MSRFSFLKNKKIWLGLGVVILLIISLLFSLVETKIDSSDIPNLKPSSEEVVEVNPDIMISLPGADPIKALEQDYQQTDSQWFLVNKQHPLPNDYAPYELVIPAVRTQEWRSQDERSVRADIAPHVVAMFNEAQANGLVLTILSGYRSASTQSIIYNNSVGQVGEEQTRRYIAFPGQSEHQTGLAIDIATSPEECSLKWCFENTGAGQWLRENAHRFGFILRYPKDKETITGYNYEPWHFRYLGTDLATAIYQSGLTLEEAWPYIEEALVKIKNTGLLEN